MDPSLSPHYSLKEAISPWTAHALSFIFTTSYVGSLYLSQHLTRSRPNSPAITRRASSSHSAEAPGDSGAAKNDNGTVSASAPGIPPTSVSDADGISALEQPVSGPPVGSRDHPETIKRRMKAVTLSTLLSLSGVCFAVHNISSSAPGSFRITLWPPPPAASTTALNLLGLRLPASFSIWQYGLAPILMIGPLVAMYMDDDLPLIGGRRFGEGCLQKIQRTWREASLIELRNYVVGPVTEELVFRSTILSVSILGGLPYRSLIFGTPLWFGIAHAHHALEVYRKNGSTSSAAVQAILTDSSLDTVFQLTYTTLFGWFASYLYLRTGSVIPPLLSHVFCNIMGIYFPSRAATRTPIRRIFVWGSYIAGIIGFVYGVKRL
ncbi:hypothetical protein I316_05245 [Kwoniella heveanensis BCC8398]|uniref:intramembrane prenyl-peptidase Rce1 n=1 Tax=Kwoniella heveanensis BCC8398 TaxID=1296120 RepID=A0A1B9GQ54_9TREE|nr:hypothetical protein I316_05245 [Kwoniella heveanensis BCC8398]